MPGRLKTGQTPGEKRHSKAVLCRSLPRHKPGTIWFCDGPLAESAQRIALWFLLLGYGLGTIRFLDGVSAESAQRNSTVFSASGVQVSYYPVLPG